MESLLEPLVAYSPIATPVLTLISVFAIFVGWNLVRLMLYVLWH